MIRVRAVIKGRPNSWRASKETILHVLLNRILPACLPAIPGFISGELSGACHLSQLAFFFLPLLPCLINGDQLLSPPKVMAMAERDILAFITR